MAAIVRSTGFVVERKVLARSCHVWAAGSPVRMVLLRLARKTVGLRGEAAVEMGEGEETHGSKLGGAVVFNRKREASAEGRRPGRRQSCGLIWVEALLLRRGERGSGRVCGDEEGRSAVAGSLVAVGEEKEGGPFESWSQALGWPEEGKKKIRSFGGRRRLPLAWENNKS